MQLVQVLVSWVFFWNVCTAGKGRLQWEVSLAMCLKFCTLFKTSAACNFYLAVAHLGDKEANIFLLCRTDPVYIRFHHTLKTLGLL